MFIALILKWNQVSSRVLRCERHKVTPGTRRTRLSVWRCLISIHFEYSNTHWTSVNAIDVSLRLDTANWSDCFLTQDEILALCDVGKCQVKVIKKFPCKDARICAWPDSNCAPKVVEHGPRAITSWAASIFVFLIISQRISLELCKRLTKLKTTKCTLKCALSASPLIQWVYLTFKEFK